MGTGEPLDNYDEVLKAIRVINASDGIGIGARRITISTCGMIPEMERLAQEKLQIELSISLHAADDRLRSRIMPVNKKYPLKALMADCQDYIKKTDRQITFEYVLIKGFNSDLQSVKDLAKILKPLRLAKVNLIPTNPIKEMSVEPPGKPEVLFFKDYLIKQGIQVTLRKSRGQDIDAACGQLRLKYEEK
jgi:23S rRNA (adenine2503-C2)-methyltransferase